MTDTNTNKKSSRLITIKRSLAGTAIAGATAVAVVATGVPSAVVPSYADPVQVQAPQAPGFANIVEAVSPAVVSVRVQGDATPVSDRSFGFGAPPGLDELPEDHPMRRFFDDFSERFGDERRGPRGGGPRPTSQGSGFFISEDGYLVTNNHVVEGGSNYSVIMNDGTELEAELIGTDSRTDLAVLKVEEAREFVYVEFGDDTTARVGDWVVAVGNPFGLGGSVTAGIISARGREIGAGPYDDFIQVDAAVNRGNSGGPTFNLSGEVIGVNTAIFSPSGGNVGIAFAIPANLARDVVTDLIEDGSVERGWIGVQIQPVTDDIADSLGLEAAEGALITSPQEGGPAAAAGLEAGDVVLSVDGQNVDDPGDLARRIGGMNPGDEVTLTLWRNGSREDVELTLETFPSDDQLAMAGEELPSGPDATEQLGAFGLTVTPAEDGTGVVVTDVAPDGVAAERGFEVGDVIVSVQDQEVSSASDISKAISAASESGRRAALFQLRSDDTSRFVALPIERG